MSRVRSMGLSISRSWVGTVNVLLLAMGVALPLFAGNYVLRTFSIFYVYLLLAAGLSIVVTYAGLLDLGYIAFFAVGAYTYALLDMHFGVPFFAAIPVGMCLAALFGLVLGFPTLRVRGDYLALVTLGFGEIIRVLLVNIWGPHGIAGISPPLSVKALGSSDRLYVLLYAVTFCAIPLVFWLLSRVDRSPLARAWFAIRDNELAARSCGVNSVRWLLLAFALGTGIAGIAGVIFAGIQRFISPASFVLDESIFVLSIVVLAGGRSRLRLVLAAGLLSLLPEVMRDLADYRLLSYGVFIICFVVGEEKWRKRTRAPSRLGRAKRMPGTQSEKVDSIPRFLADARRVETWVLSADHVTMRFGGIVAVNDVSFSLDLAGRIVGLIGPNGAGKTTLFNCIAGEYEPVAGTISYPGASAHHASYKSARCGIGRTFQTPQLFSTMTVAENIVVSSLGRPNLPIVGSLFGHRRWKAFIAQEADMAESLCDCLGLQDVASVNIGALPLAVHRRVELARALALQPRVVLLDEIASGMNSREKADMAALIHNLSRETGVGFLIVEHDMEFVMPLAEEILMLDTGRLVFRGAPAEARESRTVIDAYLGDADAIS